MYQILKNIAGTWMLKIKIFITELNIRYACWLILIVDVV